MMWPKTHNSFHVTRIFSFLIVIMFYLSLYNYYSSTWNYSIVLSILMKYINIVFQSYSQFLTFLYQFYYLIRRIQLKKLLYELEKIYFQMDLVHNNIFRVNFILVGFFILQFSLDIKSNLSINPSMTTLSRISNYFAFEFPVFLHILNFYLTDVVLKIYKNYFMKLNFDICIIKTGQLSKLLHISNLHFSAVHSLNLFSNFISPLLLIYSSYVFFASVVTTVYISQHISKVGVSSVFDLNIELIIWILIMVTLLFDHLVYSNGLQNEVSLLPRYVPWMTKHNHLPVSLSPKSSAYQLIGHNLLHTQHDYDYRLVYQHL